MRYLIAVLFIVSAFPALAQQSPIDPRLAAPAVKAMQAEIELREAMIKALREDREKHESDLAAWFKAWFGDQQVGQAETK